MPLLEYLTANPPAGALLGLLIVIVFVSLGLGLVLGRLGEEIAFICGLEPSSRRLMSRGCGLLGGMAVGAAVGATLGGKFGLGPDHVLAGLTAFLGLTFGGVLGGLMRGTEQEQEAEDRAMDRVRWVVWRYTHLELESAVGLMCGAFLGTLCGTVIEILIPVEQGGANRALQVLIGAVAGGGLGAMGGSTVGTHGRVSRVLIGMSVGAAAGVCLGLFLASMGKTQGFVIPGAIFGLIGGLCFGLIGAERVRERVDE